MTPTPLEARMVLGTAPQNRTTRFYRSLLDALDVSSKSQRTALANAFPGLVVAWVMKNSGSAHEMDLLTQIASRYH
jgi:hypothetical protein